MANFCVGPAATGDGSGDDWDNLKAWSGTPVRGDTWYLVDGDYTAKTFSVPVSGTTLITIQKATIADHGGIETGWLDTMGDGQAVITGTMTFSTNYWIFTGSKRNESNWFDGTAYGIQINAVPGTYTRSVFWRASYSTMSYIYINANVLNTSLPTVNHYQVDWTGGSLVTAGNVSRCYVHNGNNHYFMRNCEACVVEYCASDDALGSSNNHGENVNWYGFFGPSDNCVVRYCKFHDNFVGGGGTAVIAIVTSAGCQIYGNEFYNNRCSDGLVGWTGTRAGYGVVNLKFYNNTIIGGGTNSQGVHLETSSTGCQVKNNLWYNSSGAGGTTVIQDYNHYINSGGTHGEANGTSLTSGNPFLDLVGLNLRPAPRSVPFGVDLGSPYDTDADGVDRAAGFWVRGAFCIDPTYLGSPNYGAEFTNPDLPLVEVPLDNDGRAVFFGGINTQAIIDRTNALKENDPDENTEAALGIRLSARNRDTFFGGWNEQAILDYVAENS